MLLTDGQLHERVVRQHLITPYEINLVRTNRHGERVISYGQSSMGYDMRLGTRFSAVRTDVVGVIDPKASSPVHYDTFETDQPFLLPPQGYLLGVSVERFQIPEDILGLVIGKSTYARAGVLVNCTPMEPGWSGYLTIEIANLTPLPVRIYPGEGIAQALFYTASETPLVSYGARGGKYQNQDAAPVLGRA